MAAYFEESVMATATMSLVRVPLQSFVGSNFEVIIDHDQLFSRTRKLLRLLSREFEAAPPCAEFDKGYNTRVLFS